MNAKRIFLSAVVVAMLAGSPVLAKKSTTGAVLKVAGGGTMAVSAALHFLWHLTYHINTRSVLVPRTVFKHALQDGAIMLVSGYIMGKGLKDLKKIAKKRKRKWKKKK